MLTFSYFGTDLQNNKYVEITGELVLYNIKEPKANHHTFLTSKGIVEQLKLANDDEERDRILKYYQDYYKPAVKVWFVQQITRADDLIARNLELRMIP